jgi:hypothetical protein
LIVRRLRPEERVNLAVGMSDVCVRVCARARVANAIIEENQKALRKNTIKTKQKRKTILEPSEKLVYGLRILHDRDALSTSPPNKVSMQKTIKTISFCTNKHKLVVANTTD